MCLVCSMEWKCSRSRLEHVVYLLACSHSVVRPGVIADDARNTVTDLWCLSAGVGLVYFMLYRRVSVYSMQRPLASPYGAPVQAILSMLSPLCLSNQRKEYSGGNAPHLASLLTLDKEEISARILIFVWSRRTYRYVASLIVLPGEENVDILF
jgi:hypothetical protein